MNGRDALATLERQPFDIVWMDVQMPAMDGFEAMAVIWERERQTGAHLPVIRLTAHAMAGDQERCLAAGMNNYVSKQLNLGELFAMIEPWWGADVSQNIPPPRPTVNCL
jgi:CheY-like chemotaxis protein